MNAIYLPDLGSEPQRFLKGAETDRNAVWSILDRGLRDMGAGCTK